MRNPAYQQTTKLPYFVSPSLPEEILQSIQREMPGRDVIRLHRPDAVIPYQESKTPEDTPQTTGGTKYDSGKPPMDLLDGQWLEGVAGVLGFGAKKYAAHNWRKGITQSRLIGAALRHIHAHNSGENLDPESGLPHLDHASCCLMFASNMLKTRPDMDDRYKPISD